MPSSKPRIETAAQAHTRHVKEGLARLELIREYLANEATRTPCGDSVDWGDVGSMAEVNKNLREVCHFLNIYTTPRID